MSEEGTITLRTRVETVNDKKVVVLEDGFEGMILPLPDHRRSRLALAGSLRGHRDHLAERVLAL